MSENEKPPEGPEFLPYRSQSDDAPSRMKFYLMVCGGIVISSAAVAACGFIWVMGNLYLGPPPRPPHRLNWELPLGASVVILLLLVGMAHLAHRARNRGLLIGLLIGFGATFLMEGLCFARG